MAETHGGTCHHLLEELGEYLDGEAAAATCAEIERHLAECENCRAVVDTLRKTITLYRDLPPPALSEAARARLYKTLNLSNLYVEHTEE
jgi:anti-sigma factor RsiW